ncbi:MAG: class I SAM-dependent methyltransferase [Solirubrobacteraceae bacterium]
MRRCIACGAAPVCEDWSCAACGSVPEHRDGIVLLAPDAIEMGRGFDPASFGHLLATEEQSFWFRGRNELILWALRRYFPSTGSLLELGCGTGYVLRGIRAAYPSMRLAGAELYPEGLRIASSRVPDAEWLQIDVTRMPFDREWGVVGAFDVLEHIRDDEAALAGMHDAARPGAGILITVPQHPWLWSRADEYAMHERRYGRAELVSRVQRAGLEVLRVTSFVSALLPAMAFLRWRERRSGAAFDPTREHASAARLPALDHILRTERALIRRGANLPAGGSLLLVARRPA